MHQNRHQHQYNTVKPATLGPLPKSTPSTALLPKTKTKR